MGLYKENSHEVRDDSGGSRILLGGGAKGG